MNTRIYAGISVLAVAALLGGSALYITMQQSGDKFAECRTTAVSGGAGAIGGPFTLVNGEGATVTEKDVLAKPSLVYFGYTFCPDVCPMDNSRNAEAVDLLAKRGIDVTPVFISIDPDRDTPEVVRDFAKNLDPKMVGLTGTPDQVKVAAQAYKAYYKKQDSTDEFYMMDHSTFTYLMLPGTGFAEFFKRETTAPEMADAVACFVEKM